MIGNITSHGEILDKLGEGRRRRYLSLPPQRSVRQVAIKALPDARAPDTEQLGHIKCQARIWLLKELQGG